MLMLWALIFLLLGAVAGLFGFAGWVPPLVFIAKIAFFILVGLSIMLILFDCCRRKWGPPR